MRNMKLWKVLARNSYVYSNHMNPASGMELYEFKSRSPTLSEDSGKHSAGSLQDNFCHQAGVLLATVKLRRRPGEPFGIVLAPGNSEAESSCPSIASLRPGSIALASDQLVPGDRIYSINGINTSRMRPDEVSTLLDNVDESALLEIQYSLPEYASQNSLCVTTKITEITLERIDGSLGITLRGGVIPDHPHLSRPLVITQVRPGGSAFRTGQIRVGDRLLKVDSHSLTGKTLLEAQQLLRDNTAKSNGVSFTTLTIEYDVSIMDSVKYANGPLLVEIDRYINEDFGLILTNCCDLGPDEIIAAGYFVENIIAASTADRCGALGIGDQVLAIDDVVLEEWNGSVPDAERLLRTATKLQILPYHAVQKQSRHFTGAYPSSPSISGFSTLNSRRSRSTRSRFNNRQSSHHHKSFEDCGNFYGCSTNNSGICHPEQLSVTLVADNRGCGYGLGIAVGEHAENNRSGDILITRIIPDSPAYRCGCLQVGDRIITVNHQNNLTLQEINSILEMGVDSPNQKVVLQVEFDVADTIVPSSGVFTIKLAKRGPGLGITIQASKTRPEEPFLISEIRRGSTAHRTGTLHAGDRLLAIDNRPLDRMSLESAFEVLQNSTNDIVTLRIEKTETENANLFLDSVVYTVELHRYGGPLGITISGSEDCGEPIILSKLTEGGLAEKTGALHVGDRILAINGESLEHRPLSDAIRLLQTSGDRVQLKIARNIKNESESLVDDSRCNYSSPGLLSIDSAVESWGSHATDNNNETNDPNKDLESVLSDSLSYQHDKDATLTKQKKHDSNLQFYSDGEETTFCPSPLPLPNYSFSNGVYALPARNFSERLASKESVLDNEIYHVTLYKDSIYDDYGFSVSDGLYEKGVYINRIRKGGPADIVGLLRPYDRIIQVNDTKTQDFDCCLTVPLIASAGDRIELVVSRNPYMSYSSEKDLHDDMSKKSFSASQNTITKTL